LAAHDAVPRGSSGVVSPELAGAIAAANASHALLQALYARDAAAAAAGAAAAPPVSPTRAAPAASTAPSLAAAMPSWSVSSPLSAPGSHDVAGAALAGDDAARAPAGGADVALDGAARALGSPFAVPSFDWSGGGLFPMAAAPEDAAISSLLQLQPDALRTEYVQVRV
jgi:hypothetical protein